MYLKALEIQGFKSFPEKTVLPFNEEITAIVGPNGSGKSNISDAIRWVMGEQSTKNLRGSKMEDVIFGGTATRHQVGFAQVTLVIDNTEHVFPRDESEVAVTRRYYRSGESEYYINKQAVRLKDVNELFMDTGMGKEGYAIIGQGRIDEILSARSTDRRVIFEEAAGISKFRHRKEEAERKLDSTEDNLVRINDKIAELELQVEPLREQSEKAKQFLIYRDELRVLEISTWLDRLDDLRANTVKLDTDFAIASREVEEIRAQLEEIYRAQEEYSQQFRENNLKQEEARSLVAETEGKLSQQQSDKSVLQAQIENNRENIANIQREVEEQGTRTGNLEQQIADKFAAIDQLTQRMEALNGEIDELLAKAEQASRGMGDAGNKAEMLRGQEALALASAADARAQRSALEASVFEMEERSKAIKEEVASIEEQLSGSRTQARQSKKALDDAEEEAQAVQNIIHGHTIRMESRKQKDEDLSAQKMNLTMEVNNLESRIRLLEEMEKEYEGFQKGVRLVMQAAEHKSLRGIHQPVIQSLQTEKAYAVAVEIALGGAAQDIIVDKEEDAKQAMLFLKQRESGRVTFQPISAVRGEYLRQQGVEKEDGFVGIAASLIQYDSKYEGIMVSLLGRTVVVEDLDYAIAMARKYKHSFKIVTLDGQVINAGGSMTGGSINRRAGILSRANELEECRVKMENLQKKLEKVSKEAEEAHREYTGAQYELEVAQGQVRQAEDTVLKCRGEVNQYNSLIGAGEAQIASLTEEQKTIGERIVSYRENILVQEDLEKAKENEAESCRKQAEAELSGQSSLAEENLALAEEISRRKEETAALQAEKVSTEKSIADLNRLKDDMTGDQEERQQRIAAYEALIAEAENQITAMAQQGDTLQQEWKERTEKVNALVREQMNMESRNNERNRRQKEINDKQLDAERALSKLDQKRQTGQMEQEQLIEKLWESYELSYTAANEQRIELESTAKANRRITELKRSISALGNVNVGAIEQYEVVNTRYTYLSTQRDDVTKAKEELTGIIENITAEMTGIFKEQFGIINESFRQTFVELFGGGQANLELEDEHDILNCGIEIRVQPPGKTLKVLSLLSGGEKAFVAIALYFAILKVHPTPFCVMDEIEAALDESNVVRFAKYMRSIAEKTQFIVITHRRGTMEEADTLYGVTMQEQGVSRVLMASLNELAKQLKLKEK